MPEPKAGAKGEATLYRSLAGAGAGAAGATLAELRAQAQAAYERLELPTWRRSGFWRTSLEALDLDALAPREGTSGATASIDTEGCAGSIVQRDSTVVSVELRTELAEQGVLFCPLEQAATDHTELFERHYMRRLTLDRDKLEAASAAFWSGGAFLYVPAGLRIEEPFQVSYEVDAAASAQYAHTLAIGERGSDWRLRQLGNADGIEGQALHAGALELYLHDGARARLATLADWGGGEVHDVSTAVVEVGRDAFCHWQPLLLGGHLIRHHDELVVAESGGDCEFRGIFFTEADEHLDVFAVELHEAGPSGGDVHWRGAASGHSLASFEGLLQIQPGAQKTHTYLQIHTMLLSEAAKLDAIPSVLVCADDVSASHGGTVGELDESLIFYMQSRGLTRPQAVKVIVEGFFEPLIMQLDDPVLEALVRERIASKLAAAADDVERFALAR